VQCRPGRQSIVLTFCSRAQNHAHRQDGAPGRASRLTIVGAPVLLACSVSCTRCGAGLLGGGAWDTRGGCRFENLLLDLVVKAGAGSGLLGIAHQYSQHSWPRDKHQAHVLPSACVLFVCLCLLACATLKRAPWFAALTPLPYEGVKRKLARGSDPYIGCKLQSPQQCALCGKLGRPTSLLWAANLIVGTRQISHQGCGQHGQRAFLRADLPSQAASGVACLLTLYCSPGNLPKQLCVASGSEAPLISSRACLPPPSKGHAVTTNLLFLIW